MLKLVEIKRTDANLLHLMKIHYSHPKGFVGRNICYSILNGNDYYGSIVGGSASLHLPNRDEFFQLDKKNRNLNGIINNIFYHIEKVNGMYPLRNFTVEVLKLFEITVKDRWKDKYGDTPIGFETLVELPRTGELYRRNGWQLIGQTVGYQVKRIAGKGSDGWTGQRVWYTDVLRPKLVFAKLA